MRARACSHALRPIRALINSNSRNENTRAREQAAAILQSESTTGNIGRVNARRAENDDG